MTAAVPRSENVQGRVADPAFGQRSSDTFQLRLGSQHGVVVAKSGSQRQSQMWKPISRPAPVATAEAGAPAAGILPADSDQVLNFAALSETERRVVQTLAALNNAPLTTLRLNKLTGTADLSPAIASLLSRGWLRTDRQRNWLTPGLAAQLVEAYDLSTLRGWALMHFSRVVKEQLAPEELTDIIEAICVLVTWTIQTERWPEAIRLVKGVEETLVLSQSWSEWRQLLNQALIAAVELEDLSLQAWAWHQLGSLALYQQDLQTASTALRRALQLRQAVRETDAVALTRSSLREAEVRQAPAPALTAHLQLPLLAGLILGLTIVAAVLVFRDRGTVTLAETRIAALPAMASVDLSTPTSTVSSEQIVPQAIIGEQVAVADTITETPMPSPTPCTISAPSRWQKTAIRRGDTLGKLAVAHRTVVDQIMQANCLSSDIILAGSQLWLPPLPPTPTPTIPPANLLVNSVWLSGQPTAGSEAIIVPVAFDVVNDGGRPADYGTLSFSYSVAGSSERVPIGFNAAAAPTAIEAGQQVPAIGGTVAFPPQFSNQLVTLWVTAHSEQSIPVNLSLPAPVVRIDSMEAGRGDIAALLYNEGNEQWYTEMTLAGHIDNEAAFQVESWEWRNGNTVIGNEPSVALSLSSDTDCIPYDITLRVTVSYFGGAYTMSESAGIGSDCASN